MRLRRGREVVEELGRDPGGEGEGPDVEARRVRGAAHESTSGARKVRTPETSV